MNAKLLSGALGAEISGINLKDSSKENYERINALLLEHKVIFFRNQNITQEEQIALAENWGPLETHAYVKGLDKHPEIVRIVKTKDEKNQWGIHSSLGAEFFIDNYKGMSGHEKRNYNEYSNEHPIVRTHPETGKKILYVNWTYTKQIIGLEKKENDEILKEIFEHQARLDLTCRFNWTENAVAIWDNRSVIHYAIADFYPGRGLGHERIMDRIAIEGDQPH